MFIYLRSLSQAIQRDVRIPTGSIVAFYGDTAPLGWLLCDGSNLSMNHRDLRLLIGTKVPDLRGTFLRGANNGRQDGKGDAETIREIGSYQGDMLGAHSHSISLQGASGNNAFVNRDPAWGYDNWHGAVTVATTAVQGGAETRPKNVAVNFIIKL